MCFRARMRMALSQAKTRAATMTPMSTASARLCAAAVTPVTSTMMSTSEVGIRRKVRREAHSNDADGDHDHEAGQAAIRLLDERRPEEDEDKQHDGGHNAAEAGPERRS